MEEFRHTATPPRNAERRPRQATKESVEADALGAQPANPGEEPPSDEDSPEIERQPGEGRGWTKLKGDQGWRDERGRIWKKDRLHKDHWDVMDRHGNKIREADFTGRRIWPNGPKNKNKTP